MKKNLLLGLFFSALLCVFAMAADEPEMSFEVVELPPEMQVLFGGDFLDVDRSHWAYKEIKKAVQLGLTTGRGDGTFVPAEQITRAEAVTMIHRMAGSPQAEKKAQFTDVGGWYEAAVDWAAESGVVNGISETQFGADGTLTRAQLVTMLYRLSGSASGMEMMFTSLYDAQFADSGEIALWAKNAMYWGIYKELIRGTAADMLSPERAVTRAEAVAMLVRYAENLK